MDPKEIQDKGDWLRQTLYGIGGALDSAAYGAPGWLLGKIAPDFTEKWKASPGYKTGRTVGTAVSGLSGQFVPQLVKGVITDPNIRGFMAGVGNANLMGAPEWAAKKIFGPERVEDWKAKNAGAYKTGKVAGTIGSALVPTGQIIKGAGVLGKGGAALAQGFGAAGSGLANLGAKAGGKVLGGALSKVLPMAAGAALEGGLQSAARAGFGGGSAEDVAKAGLSGAGWGGVGGAVGGGLTYALGKYGPKIVQNLSKKASRAVEGLTDLTKRDMNKVIAISAGPGAGGIGKNLVAEDVTRATSDLIKKYHAFGVTGEGVIEGLGKRQQNIWRAIDAANEAGGKLRGADIIKRFISPDDIAKLTEEYGEEAVGKALENLGKGPGRSTGLAAIRKNLWNAIKTSRLAQRGTELADNAAMDAMGDLAGVVRGRLDDAAIDTFEAAGGQLPDGMTFPEFKGEHKIIEALSAAEARATGTPLRFNLGSNTQFKTGIQHALAGAPMAAAGGGLGSLQGDTAEERATNAIIGAGLGYAGQKALGSLAGRGLASADDLLRNAVASAGAAGPALMEAAPEVASSAGRLLAATAQGVKGAQEEGRKYGPEDSPARRAAGMEQTQAADEGAQDAKALAAGDEQTYNQRILGRIDEFWVSSGAEQMFPGGKEEFARMVYQATNGFDPVQMAGVLYRDPAQKESYLKALQVNQALGGGLFEQAADQPGFFQGLGEKVGIGRDEALARETAEQGVLGAVSGVAPEGITAKMIQGTVNSILSGSGTPEDKRARLEIALRNYGVDMNLLREVGLL